MGAGKNIVRLLKLERILTELIFFIEMIYIVSHIYIGAHTHMHSVKKKFYCFYCTRN